MKHFTKTLLAAGALAVSALAHAAPVVTWNAAVTGTWTAYAPNPGVSLTGGGTVLSWGEPNFNDRSSLTITNPGATNPITTYVGGGTVPAVSPYLGNSVTLTHRNQPIGGDSLTSATLTVNLTLTPTSPSGAAAPLGSVPYVIRFVETPNQTPCAVTSPTPCNDIFVQVSGLLNQSFEYDDVTYFINAFPLTPTRQLSSLTPAACAAAGLGSGCLGFTTAENASTVLPFGLTISTERLAVPEPGSLALIGLALAGLGFVSRRRSAA